MGPDGEAMRFAGVPRLVFSPTTAVYGEPEAELVPIPETTPTCPTMAPQDARAAAMTLCVNPVCPTMRQGEEEHQAFLGKLIGSPQADHSPEDQTEK